MAIIGRTEEQREIDRREELEDLKMAAEADDRRHQHQLAIIEARNQVPGHTSWARGIVAIAKSPALVALAITLPILILRGKEVPKFLQDFLSI